MMPMTAPAARALVRNTLRASAIAAAGLMLHAVPAGAQAADTSALTRPDRVLQITPYGWAAALDGKISPFRRLPAAHVRKDFKDILSDLNFAGFVQIWGRQDRFVFSGDMLYVNLGESQVIGALPQIGPTPGLSASVDTSQFTATAQAGYRVIETSRFSLDLLGGARFWHVDTEVSLYYTTTTLKAKSSFGWVDPLVSARAFLRLTQDLSAMLHADVGGFGLGSRNTWQVLGTLNYDLGEAWTVSAGYKALSVDYRSGGHVYDATMSGPVFGVTYRF